MSQNKIPYNIHPLILVLPSKVTLNFLFHIRTLELPKDGCLFFSRLHLCCFINCFPRLLLPDSLLFCGSPLSSLLFVRICLRMWGHPMYETAKETLMYRTVLWTLRERERVGRFGRMALKHVKYHV